jgi:glycerol-3-phosphate acyltransferase PlsX
MKIAVDAMGGDFAPEEVVKGAVEGARQHMVGIILVGQEGRINNELGKYDTNGLDIDIVHTDQWIMEGEHPAFALREKRNASILLAVKLVKSGKADAAVSSGNTGGVVAAALSVLGTIEGISRPVFGGIFLETAPRMFAADLGGNVDVRPHQLLDFAVIGSVYIKKMFNITDPTVALLSNGKEEGKGNELTKAAVPLFKKSGLNFIGCLEGNDLALGAANVIVCDAFVGNIVVKFGEGLGLTIIDLVKKELTGKLPESDIQSLNNKIFRATNSADSKGGGPMLGVNGIVCKGHGRSKAPEIAKNIGEARFFIENGLVKTLGDELLAARRKVTEIYQE